MFQIIGGVVPSPYEDNSPAAYFHLDGTDISQNQEKVFNQVTGEWEAIILDIPSSSILHKFVDPSVTTRQRYEELPTCKNDEGLYLDPSALICKEIEYYALASYGPDALVLPLPELRDGGGSWSLSFWLYSDDSSPGNVMTHQDSNGARFYIDFIFQWILRLVHSSGTALVSIPPGHYSNNQWCSVSIVCSDSTLENECNLFVNFVAPSAASTYTGLLFL